ncbi:XRE family transcriptional regulator [Paenibacillus sp. MER 180]|uniref:XRE family transcriptional regulator n=1 Tax=Paenibacillus sp. MER 180 TaxID=2939570 RepID=UPI00203B7325|nr:XRE family transcriptional regulator [Paenibacillus sp. MER 180]MCM3292021.1 XRE family transcriptional regulator [Paenibacillus sp. MER 180]
MGSVIEVYENIGELIKCYRDREGITQQDLAKLVGVDDEIVLTIEKGELPLGNAVLQTFINVLHIPLAELVTILSECEGVSLELWLILLDTSFSNQDRQITIDILVHLLASSVENNELSLSKVIQLIQQKAGNIDLRLELLDYAISFAAIRDMQICVAKGNFYRYLVARDDFSKMEDTYQLGRGVLRYAELLSCEERVILYYKLGAHAFNLERFYESIEFGMLVDNVDDSDDYYKAYSLLLLCSSYFRLDEYDLSEYYLNRFSKYQFPCVQERVNYMISKLNEKRGNIELAINQLQQCLAEANYKINIVNSLLSIYFSSNDKHSAAQLLQREHEYLKVDFSNPISITGHAYYYKNKGRWLHRFGKIDEAVECYIKSVSVYVVLTENDEALLRKMERARLQMISVAETGRNLTDSSVVQLSQELDDYIVEIQKRGILKRFLLME